MTNSRCQWLHSSVGWNVAPVSRDHGIKPRLTPEFFRLHYAIAKIAFLTARIIAHLIIMLLIIISSEFIVRSTNLQRVKKIKCGLSTIA